MWANIFVYQLAELQRKVRSEVAAEYWLRERCAYPDRQLYDWGMMRLPSRPIDDMGGSLAMEADERMRKKRDAEVLIIYPIFDFPQIFILIVLHNRNLFIL